MIALPKATALVLLSLGLTGCAGTKLPLPADLPLQSPALKLSVPFVGQAQYECGPAALAMVMQGAGMDVSAEDLSPEVYLPARQGSLQTEMLAAARRRGLLAITLPPQSEALLREVASGHPVVVFQNLGLQAMPVWHYAVLTGWDSPQGPVRLHSGETADMPMSWTAFVNTWERGGRWAMLALKPEQLPASIPFADWLAAVAALERIRPREALSAYQAGQARWPQESMIYAGMGNARYRWLAMQGQGPEEQVERDYEFALQLDRSRPEVWHNLAQVRWERGRHAQALQAIDEAIRRAGPRKTDHEQLRSLIISTPLLDPERQARP